MGSLEAGKHADFVLWNDNPLSVYAKVLQTWIEGRRYFDIEQDKKLRDEIRNKRNALIQKALSANGNGNSNAGGKKKTPKSSTDCMDMKDYVGGWE